MKFLKSKDKTQAAHIRRNGTNTESSVKKKVDRLKMSHKSTGLIKERKKSMYGVEMQCFSPSRWSSWYGVGLVLRCPEFKYRSR